METAMFTEQEYVEMYKDYCSDLRENDIKPEDFEQFKKGMDLVIMDTAKTLDNFAERFVKANS